MRNRDVRMLRASIGEPSIVMICPDLSSFSVILNLYEEKKYRQWTVDIICIAVAEIQLFEWRARAINFPSREKSFFDAFNWKTWRK